MHQYIGLILLIVAVAAGLYLATHTGDLLNLKLEVPVFKPVPLPPSINGEPQPESEPTAVIEARKAARISLVSRDKVLLSANVGHNETVDITGWAIESNKGAFTIPQAQEIYSFGGAESDINLRSGDRVYLYPGRGAKGNIRLNKCLGYIEGPKKCPAISRSEITGFSGACQDYLLSLNVCESPVANPPVPHDDAVCFDFLSKLNYVGCVERYGNDSNFLSNEVWVWVEDRLDIFDSLHDKIQLLDKEGNVVDEYVY